MGKPLSTVHDAPDPDPGGLGHRQRLHGTAVGVHPHRAGPRRKHLDLFTAAGVTEHPARQRQQFVTATDGRQVAHSPETVTSRTTRDTPAAPIGNHSRSLPTASMSVRMR